MNHKALLAALICLGLLPASCGTAPPPSTPIEQIAGEQTVHCLLPAVTRRLGNVIYPARRQLVFETETRCSLRGGEYTVYDRASAQSSADFYLGPAEGGNAEAQYSLALVYESLFSPPRFQDAAYWYQQAADQNHLDAMKNLAYLYEQGLGVAKDSLLAIELLRRSGGIMEDLVLASEMDQAVSEAAAEIRRLTEALESQNQQSAELQNALALANQEVFERRRQLQNSQAELTQLSVEAEALSRQLSQNPTQNASTAATAQLESLTQNLQLKERQVSDQELMIASLEADLEATRAQLDASERRAELQKQRLQTQLADADAQSAENAAMQQTLAARDVEISALNEAIGGLQNRLGTEQLQTRALLDQIQTLSGDLIATRGQSQALETLLTTLNAREEIINEQSLRIQELEQRQQMAEASANEVQQLENELAELRATLQNQQHGYSELQTELESARAAAQIGQEQAAELEQLLSEVSRRGEIIADQSAQIEQLQAQSAQARNAMEMLAESQQSSVEELDLVNARLVSAESELVQTRSELVKLETQLAQEELAQLELRGENELLRSQLQSASSNSTQQAAQMQQQLRMNDERIAEQSQLILDLQDEIAQRQTNLAVVEQERERQLALRSIPRTTFPTMPEFRLPNGTKRALVIGNDSYLDDNIKDLTTAVTGAIAMAEVLESKYGFETTLLTNATRREIMYAFSELQSIQGENDYVLIYYAGHGARSSRDESITYWLPVEAQANELSFEADGIKSDWITNELRAMKARHVMIVADSCYAGAMVRPPRVSVAEQQISPRRLEWLVNRRSRTVLSSGGDAPVLDASFDGNHSVFTKALLELLETNTGIIYGEALHAALREMVRFNAEQLDFTQIPLFSEIAAANHGNGQFVFSAAGI